MIRFLCLCDPIFASELVFFVETLFALSPSGHFHSPNAILKRDCSPGRIFPFRSPFGMNTLCDRSYPSWSLFLVVTRIIYSEPAPAEGTLVPPVPTPPSTKLSFPPFLSKFWSSQLITGSSTHNPAFQSRVVCCVRPANSRFHRTRETFGGRAFSASPGHPLKDRRRQQQHFTPPRIAFPLRTINATVPFI